MFAKNKVTGQLQIAILVGALALIPIRTQASSTAVRDVVISEVAWAGTVADINDEWIELHNNTASPIDLNGWTLTAADGTPNIVFPSVTIPANGYFLLERTDDAVLPAISADLIYTGALGNTGEVLTLRDAGAVVVDTANNGNTAWLAGDSTTKATMQRLTLTAADGPSNWQNGVVGSAVDANSNVVLGSPQNSGLPTPTPAPTSTPTAVLSATPLVTSTPAPSTGWIINEINADPDTVAGDSNRDGIVSSDDDEFIELVNNTGNPVNVSGWGLFDASVSPRFVFPAGVIVPAGCAVVVFGGGTPTGAFGNSLTFTTGSLGLGNSGDQVALRDGNSATQAIVTYGIEAGNNQSLTRNPDLTGSYVEHSTANTTLRFSPGTKLDGSTPFGSNCAVMLTPTTTPTPSRTPAPTAVVTATPSATMGATATAGASPTAGATPTNGATPLPALPGSVVINEVGWAGTLADANDEWLELYNTTGAAINLTGWVLAAADGSPNITLIGTIPANGYFLLERTDDNTIANIVADQIYAGILTNTTENLTLKDVTNTLVSTANNGAAAWFAGDAVSKASMSRFVATNPDIVTNWCNGLSGSATDALSNAVLGSPKAVNSCAATPTAMPATNTIVPVTPSPTQTLPASTFTATATRMATNTPVPTATAIPATPRPLAKIYLPLIQR
jgi:hypothetical protein